MSKCPACGNSGLAVKSYPEGSKCKHCGASFFGSDKPIYDQLVSVSIKIRASQREKTKGVNLSEKVRDWIDTDPSLQ